MNLIKKKPPQRKASGKALELAVTQIEKLYGKGAITRRGNPSGSRGGSKGLQQALERLGKTLHREGRSVTS